LTAVREASRQFGFDLFINARIDAWMFLEFSKEEKISECLKRAETYLAAGADSIFIPDLEDMDEETIATLVNGIDAPLNIIAGSSTPAVSRLYELGVKRLSFGPRPMRAVLSLLKEIAREVNAEGTYELMSESSISYAEMNQWFLGRK
jgi:2-methylisocitrate lyase-like PEP mutase family enzyme